MGQSSVVDEFQVFFDDGQVGEVIEVGQVRVVVYVQVVVDGGEV